MDILFQLALCNTHIINGRQKAVGSILRKLKVAVHFREAIKNVWFNKMLCLRNAALLRERVFEQGQ